MVEFRIRIHPKQRLAYIPHELAEMLGPEVRAVPDRGGVFLYSRDADPRVVLESLEIIRRDLELSLRAWGKRSR